MVGRGGARLTVVLAVVVVLFGPGVLMRSLGGDRVVAGAQPSERNRSRVATTGASMEQGGHATVSG